MRADPRKPVTDAFFTPGNYLPLRLLFLFPSLNIGDDAPVFNKRLLEALFNIDPIAAAQNDNYYPLDPLRRRILNGMEQYRYMSLHHLPYHLARADRAIALHFQEFFSDVISGKLLVELCVGDGEKTAEILGRCARPPRHIVINDILAENLTQAAKQICAVPDPYPKNRLIKVQGDINKDIWQDVPKRPRHPVAGFQGDVLEFVKRSRVPAVGLWQGATLNDLPPTQMVQQLHFLTHALGPDAVSLISVDCGVDEAANRASYDYKFLQLCLCAGLHGLQAAYPFDGRNGSAIDPREWTCEMDISVQAHYTDLLPRMRHMRTGATLPFEPIRKLDEQFLNRLVGDADAEHVVPRMRFQEDGADHCFIAIQQKGRTMRLGLGN